MLHDLANDGGFIALKWAAEDREGWRHREKMSKTCCTAEDDDDCITKIIKILSSGM